MKFKRTIESDHVVLREHTASKLSDSVVTEYVNFFCVRADVELVALLKAASGYKTLVSEHFVDEFKCKWLRSLKASVEFFFKAKLNTQELSKLRMRSTVKLEFDDRVRIGFGVCNTTVKVTHTSYRDSLGFNRSDKIAKTSFTMEANVFPQHHRPQSNEIQDFILGTDLEYPGVFDEIKLFNKTSIFE